MGDEKDLTKQIYAVLTPLPVQNEAEAKNLRLVAQQIAERVYDKRVEGLRGALRGWQDHLRDSLNCMDAKEQALYFAARKALADTQEQPADKEGTNQ